VSDRARIVDFLWMTISWQSPRRYHDIVTIATIADDRDQARDIGAQRSTLARPSLHSMMQLSAVGVTAAESVGRWLPCFLHPSRLLWCMQWQWQGGGGHEPASRYKTVLLDHLQWQVDTDCAYSSAAATLSISHSQLTSVMYRECQ